MKISILTLFPEMFSGPFSESIVKRAIEKQQVDIELVQIRNFGIGNHKMVDDRPFGGGVGMVMRVDVIDNALNSVKDVTLTKEEEQVILLDARGKTFNQSSAISFSKLKHLILLCGHYEGVDERVRSLVDQTISLGDFIVTGGEIPAMLITDAVVRLLPGVLKEHATGLESFSLVSETKQLLEYPQYTMPREYKGMKVPDILVSGNHPKIKAWQKVEAEKITKLHRPDLLR